MHAISQQIYLQTHKQIYYEIASDVTTLENLRKSGSVLHLFSCITPIYLIACINFKPIISIIFLIFHAINYLEWDRHINKQMQTFDVVYGLPLSYSRTTLHGECVGKQMSSFLLNLRFEFLNLQSTYVFVCKFQTKLSCVILLKFKILLQVCA